MSEIEKTRLMKMAANIVAAYVANNTVSVDELPELFGKVFAQINRVASPEDMDAKPRPEPAVPVDKSLSDDAIICLEDGQSFQSLKRHLRVKYNMTPEAYREKWGLPRDYPMVAPNYAKRRSALAKKTGLGKNR